MILYKHEKKTFTRKAINMGVTIKDIAKRAGVSIATVSRVINDNYSVSQEVKEKVFKAITELNYYPNLVARSLKNDTTFTIGFVVSNISNIYFTSIAKAVEDVMNKKGYNIIFCSTEHQRERELNYLRLLMSKKVDALIINTTGENDDFIAKLSERIPVVLLDRKINNSTFKGDFIDNNNIQGGYDLTHHLLSMGHRKIGIINGKISLSTGLERFEGFKRAMSEVGINVCNDYLYKYDGDFTVESGYQGVSKLMSLEDRPTAIVSMNNHMTIGVLKYCKAYNINVPQEISIASYGNVDNIDLMYTQPSEVTLNLWLIGKKTGEMILERINNKNIGSREVVFSPQLKVGNGVRKI